MTSFVASPAVTDAHDQRRPPNASGQAATSGAHAAAPAYRSQQLVRVIARRRLSAASEFDTSGAVGCLNDDSRHVEQAGAEADTEGRGPRRRDHGDQRRSKCRRLKHHCTPPHGFGAASLVAVKANISRRATLTSAAKGPGLSSRNIKGFMRRGAGVRLSGEYAR